MKDCDELKQMFHARLGDAELPVDEGLWDELQSALGPSALHTKRWHSGRWWMVAASLLLLLGVASLCLWLTQPPLEQTPLAISTDKPSSYGGMEVTSALEVNRPLPQASLPQASLSHASLPHTQRTLAFSPAHHATSQGSLHLAAPAAYRAGEAESDHDDEEEMVHVQVTIRIQEQGFIPRPGSAYQTASATARQTASMQEAPDVHEPATEADEARNMKENHRTSPWALKAGMGTALGKGDASMPFTASLTAEHRLGRYLALESGVAYHCLPHRGTTYHYIEIPLRMQCVLASSEQFELYALAGGSAEKCVAGAPSSSFSAESVRLAVQGGLGVRYRLSDRLAFFAEPTLSHHFSTDSANSSLRTERSNNFNLLCGLRVNY